MNKACPQVQVVIGKQEVVYCDELHFPWKMDENGYFLVRLHEGLIACGFVNTHHEMIIELRGKDPDKIIKEICRRDLCDKEHVGYIASELMIAHDCLVNGKTYVQR